MPISTPTASPKTVATGPKPAPRPAAPSGVELWGKGFYGIFLNPQTAEWSGIKAEDRARWELTFPAIGIDEHLRRAATWCIDNPTKGRKSDYRSFLSRWLAKEQDDAARKSTNNTRPDSGGSGSRGRGSTDAAARRADQRGREFPETITADQLLGRATRERHAPEVPGGARSEKPSPAAARADEAPF